MEPQVKPHPSPFMIAGPKLDTELQPRIINSLHKCLTVFRFLRHTTQTSEIRICGFELSSKRSYTTHRLALACHDGIVLCFLVASSTVRPPVLVSCEFHLIHVIKLFA